MKNKVSDFDNNSKEFSYDFLFKKLMRKVSFIYQLLGQEEMNWIFIFRKEKSEKKFFHPKMSPFRENDPIIHRDPPKNNKY